MKKIKVILVIAAVALTLAACGKTDAGKTVSGTPQEIIEKIYSNVQLEDSEYKGWLSTGLAYTPITADNVGYYLGIEDVAIESGTASEPLMSAQAFSICVIKVADDTDIEQLKSDIAANVNPNKWICVGVDPSDVIVDNVGSTVILIMADESEAFHKAFLELAE